MCIITPETNHLLSQTQADLRHQIFITLSPQLVAVSERAGHPAAGRLNDVLPNCLRAEWRKLVVPIDGLPVITDQIVFRQCQTLHKAAR